MFAAKIFPIKTVCTAYKNSIVRLRIALWDITGGFLTEPPVM
jgi:hypothetical protein